MFDEASDKPLHVQIYAGLRERILDGRLRPGTRIPSSRSLAADLNVSRTTVLTALGQLRAEGYVEATRGSGTYVTRVLPEKRIRPPDREGSSSIVPASPPLSAFASRLAAIPPYFANTNTTERLPFDFRLAEPATADFPLADWKLAVRAEQGWPGTDYLAPEGLPELRAAISGYLDRSRGVVAPPERIVVLDGAQQGFDLLARLLVDPGSPVVVEDPPYQGVRQVMETAGGVLVGVPVDDHGLDPDLLPEDGAATRLVCVAPSHQFPTGGVMPVARRLKLLEWANRFGAFVVEDDYDGEFMYATRPLQTLFSLDQSSRVIYLGTFSKTLSPELRIGYAVLPESLVAAFRAAKWQSHRFSAPMTQRVLAKLIASGRFERHVRRVRRRNAFRREAFLRGAEEHLGTEVRVSGADAGGHMLLWLNDIALGALDEVVTHAASVGVGVLPATPYFIRKPPQAGLLLFHVALSTEEIVEGLRRLRIAIDRTRNGHA